MKKIETIVQQELFNLEDITYKDFQSKLIPTVNPKTIIGVRSPALRKYAKEFAKTSEYLDYLHCVPHKYYEENNLHVFVIEGIKDFDLCVNEMESFLPYIDNWATCDSPSPKAFKKNPDKILPYLKKWIKSDKTFTIRFGVNMLMRLFLDERFLPEYPLLVSKIKSDEYYVNMMVAWYFATALAKQYDAIIPYIENKKLAPWTHNKTIQKAIESFRITDEQKAYLRTLKVVEPK